jgi:hypothetical protein
MVVSNDDQRSELSLQAVEEVVSGPRIMGNQFTCRGRSDWPLLRELMHPQSHPRTPNGTSPGCSSIGPPGGY